MSQVKRIYLHPLPVRIWHWINALGFLTLILTGLVMRYPEYVGFVSPDVAVSLHNATGFVLIANYFIWLIFYLSSDKIDVYLPELSPKKNFRDTIRQVIFYAFGIMKGAKNPHHGGPINKFNPLQKVTYQVIMLLLVPAQFITGVLLWDVTRFAKPIAFIGGLRVLDTIHVLLFIFFAAFIIGHAYLATLGPKWHTHFTAMFSGYEEEEED